MILNIGDIQHIEHELDSGHEFPFHEYSPEDFIETIQTQQEEIEQLRISASNAPTDGHNPADIEALKQVREALELADCWCEADDECPRCVALTAIDKMIGGGQDA